MKLFHGVHEIRLFRRPYGVAVGYFTSEDAALRAIEREAPTYKASYFTLNPVKVPEGVTLNPETLTLMSETADDASVIRRVWLLIDFDPLRGSGNKDDNSTDEEKQTARSQAEQVREYLRAQRWPEPSLCDSGNGWHQMSTTPRVARPVWSASWTSLGSFMRTDWIVKKRFNLLDEAFAFG